ncbi:hypothetical protein COK06_00010 [Bacillus cereus]|nr:hypothetical protein COI72_02405 [Bacillus cereus]PFQ00500.1 hypothetical protein COK06_00010 [Bacillus cereus]
MNRIYLILMATLVLESISYLLWSIKQKIRVGIGDCIDIKGIKINPENILYINEGENMRVMEIIFMVSNESEKDFDRGAGDFGIIDLVGNKLGLCGRFENFWGEVLIGETLSGQGYYQVNESEPNLLVYNLVDNRRKGVWIISKVKK